MPETIVSQVFTVLVTCHWNPVEPQKTDGETIRNPRKHKYEISYNLKSLADLPKEYFVIFWTVRRTSNLGLQIKRLICTV